MTVYSVQIDVHWVGTKGTNYAKKMINWKRVRERESERQRKNTNQIEKLYIFIKKLIHS